MKRLIISPLLMILCVMAFTSCVPMLPGSKKSSGQLKVVKNLNSNSIGGIEGMSEEEYKRFSIQAFEKTVKPIVRANCINCHGENKVFSPFFALDDSTQAWEALVYSGKVNFDATSSSRLHNRLLKDKHNCWGGSCENSAKEMLAAINEWAAMLKNADLGPGSEGIFTENLSRAQARRDIAQTEEGIVVLQAEDATLGGRMVVKSHSKASNLLYVEAPKQPNHPNNNKPRSGQVASCADIDKPVVTGDTIETRNPYYITEMRRHPDQNGWVRYYAPIRVRLINPNKLDEYKDMVRTGDFSGIRTVELRSGVDIIDKNDTEDTSDDVFMGLDGSKQYLQVLKILPDNEGYDYLFNEDGSEKTTGVADNFFAARYDGSRFFKGHNDLKNIITPEQKKNIIFPKVYQKYLDIYFKGENYLTKRKNSLADDKNDRVKVYTLVGTSMEDMFKVTYDNAETELDNYVYYEVGTFVPGDNNKDVVGALIENTDFSVTPTIVSPATVDLTGGGTHSRYIFEPNETAKKTFKLKYDNVSANLNEYYVINEAGNKSATSLSVKERTPASIKHKINVKESGRYTFWAKVLVDSGNDNSFFVRLRNNRTNELQKYYFSHQSGQKGSCFTFNTTETTSGTWYWDTANRDNESRRMYWDLNPGEYTLEIFEKEDGIKIDLVALSANEEFNPYGNLIDEGLIADASRSILSYNLSAITGVNSRFEIEIKDFNEESYILRNPKIVSPNSNIAVNDIRIFINDEFEYSNATYRNMDYIVGKNSQIMTYAPMIILKKDGSEADRFKIRFGEISATSAAKRLPSARDDATVPVDGRSCRDLDLFVRTVKPILKDVTLMEKGTYEEYVGGFPGSGGGRAMGPPETYQCMGCHNEEHPLFKMTTFDDATLCSQALSRVDYNNLDTSLLIRGLNGSHGHRKFHFVQKLLLNNDKTEFQKDSNAAKGYKQADWLGRFHTYSSSDINSILSQLGNSVGEDQKNYIRGLKNTYKRVSYSKWSESEIFNYIAANNIDDPSRRSSYTSLIGSVKTVNATAANMGDISKLKSGANAYSSYDYRGLKDNKIIRPGRDNAVHVKPTADSSDEDFEGLKSYYREIVKKWMKREEELRNKDLFSNN